MQGSFGGFSMKIKINLWSFILALICIGLFFISISSEEMVEFLTNFIHRHPLYIVLIMSIITCILGFIGLYEAVNWKLLLRSFFTIVVTLVISVFIVFMSIVSFMIQ